MTSMETEGYVSWDLLSDIVFTGIPSMTVFGDGDRMYFPVNQGFAYQLDADASTSFDPNNQDMPQGTELSVSTLHWRWFLCWTLLFWDFTWRTLNL